MVTNVLRGQKDAAREGLEKHARRDETLRSPNTLEALAALSKGAYVGDEDAYQPQRRGFDEVFVHGGAWRAAIPPEFNAEGDATLERLQRRRTLEDKRYFKPLRGQCAGLTKSS